MKFKIPKWEKYIEKITQKVKTGLFPDDIGIESHLYKLLIYKEGGFSLSLRDSEKEQGMFGTLIINLPSPHTGGELNVRFDGKEEKLDFSTMASDYEIAFTAFFADCEHEVLPVQSGYRLCLVYNLVQYQEKGHLNPALSQQVSQLSAVLEKASSLFANGPMAVLLAHDYTPANFSQASLKHHVRPRAHSLIEAAEKAGYFAAPALITKHKMGSADYEYDGYYGNDNGTLNGMEEVFEENTHAKVWAIENIPGLGEIGFSDDQILADYALDEGEASEEFEEGYTGNAGMTVEYWYHHGAIVIWPMRAHLEIINRCDIGVKLNWLEYYSQDLSKYKEHVLHIIANINETDTESRYKQQDFSIVVKLFTQLGDALVLKKQFPLFLRIFDHVDTIAWINLFASYNPTIFNGFIQSVLHSGNTNFVKLCLDVMTELVKK